MKINYRLQEAIANDKLVIFAGSGLSKQFDLPTWDRLVIDVINNIDNPKFTPLITLMENGLMEPFEVLEKLKSEHSQIKKYILNNFKITKGNFKIHKTLLELTGQVITTNYDNAFELASENKINPTVYTSTFNISEINKSDQQYIFKIHGSYTEPDKCIIFRNQYEDLYSTSAAKEKLKSIFSEKIILFLGFSFRDPDISILFNTLDEIYENNNQHFILTPNPKDFDGFKFLKSIEINDYTEVETFINYCKEIKNQNGEELKELSPDISVNKERIALIALNPIDLEFKDEIANVIGNFDSLNTSFNVGTLNMNTLLSLDDYDLIIIISKVYKGNIYVEESNLQSNLMEPNEIFQNIPNENTPIILITNEDIKFVENRPAIYISSFKNSIIKKFIHKTFNNGELNFIEKEIFVNHLKNFPLKIEKGISNFESLYNNNRDLEIGKKSLTNVIGRIEEQTAIASKLFNIKKSNKLLTIKASGGTGKTTLIKKVAYELYNRGFYHEGVSFRSCENVKTYEGFEELLIEGFNLNNIVNFKEYLIENFSHKKLDLLIILDNFETVANELDERSLTKAIELLRFATDYASIVITSRERISSGADFEDVYSLPPLITDDALILFEENYGKVKAVEEIKILRSEILEDLLNNNPLAIKLVTNSRTRFKHIGELKKQLKENFFESTNEDFTKVFTDNADLNIERTKSIYQSINYSYSTLTSRQKVAFELLNLFPDGISLSNFKKCFKNSESTNNISDKELRVLKDKSLVEDYNGTLQLQPIIRRFAEFQFKLQPAEKVKKYCLDAYLFNSFILDIIQFIEKKDSLSKSLELFNHFKNNLLNVLSYIPEIEINDKGPVPEKKYLINFIYDVEDFFLSKKQVNEFLGKLHLLEDYFNDLPNATIFLKVLRYNKEYFHREFDYSYRKLSSFLSIEDMSKRNFEEEDFLETKYKNIVSNVHSMEGYTLQYLSPFVKNNETTNYLDSHFFYLGISDNISRKEPGFYYFEYDLMFKRLNVNHLETHIESLYMEEHLEIMQCTYTLSKVKSLKQATIQKLVVTNPYTKGLKELMFAFNCSDNEKKIIHFEKAIQNLSHIKYYYLEALFYYSKFLKTLGSDKFEELLQEGLSLSDQFKYQYIYHLFSNFDLNKSYEFSYSFYPLTTLKGYVEIHNSFWEEKFQQSDVTYGKRKSNK